MTPRAEIGLDSRLVALAVASGLMMDLVDSAALATALPTMAKAFHIAPVALKLALTAYIATVAALVPASGWLADRLGAKYVFLGAMMVFLAGSTACAFSNSVGQLVAARVLQGVGGSMMTPVGRTIMVGQTKREDLVKTMGWFTAPAVVGPLFGPPLAGLLIQTASWRWIFFLNVPIAILGILAVVILVPRPGARRGMRFDALGFALVSTTILCLLAVAEARDLLRPWWAYGLAGVASAVAYFYYQRRIPDAILDLRLFRHPTLAVSLAVGVLVRFSIGAFPFLLPLFMQVGLGIAPLSTTVVTILMALGAVSSRFTLPPFLKRYGYKKTMATAAILAALLGVTPPFFGVRGLLYMGLTLMVMSVIRGTLVLAANTLIYADVEPGEISHASTLVSVTQQVSLGAGVSLGGWLLVWNTPSSGILTPTAFIAPFAVVGVMTVLAVLPIMRLHPLAGGALSGGPSSKPAA